MSELAAATQRSGVAATISGSTIWRWLDADAIRPWLHRSWLFPRDPAFEAKAGRILDLYARTWDGAPLTDDEFVLSADEKTSIQARRRIHATVPARAGHVMQVEHEYARAGAWPPWPRGTCPARKCLAAVNRAPASPRSIDWSRTS